MLAVLSPGQGSQKPGFLTPWLDLTGAEARLRWWSSLAGVDLVHVDDDFPNAAKAGLPIVTPEHGHRLGATYAD